MKKSLLYLLILFPLCGFFASCDDDNEIGDDYAETSGDYWDGISGTYRGKMNVSVDGVSIDTIIQQAEITSDDRNRMTLAINSIVVDENIQFRNISFKNVYLNQVNNTITFHATTVQNLGNIANVSLELQGTVNGADIDLTVYAHSVTMRSVSMNLKGSKLEKPLNTEAQILKMTLDHPLITSQPTFGYSSSYNIIYVYVADTLHLTDSTEIFIRPEFELPKGATISYPDSLMNFAGKEVTYTVWAEDSIHRTKYRVSLIQSMLRKFEFNIWKNVNGWEEPQEGWATNNGQMKAIMDQGGYTGNYPVVRTKGKNVGEWAAQMETVMTGEGANQQIFAGAFFQGSFDLSMQAPLYGPEYGTLFSGRPTTVKGYYKYTPSGDVYVGNSLFQDTMKFNDTCRIQAILYEVVNPDDQLDSLNYINDPKVVAVAEMGRQAGVYQPEFTDFSLQFEFLKSYNVNRRYKLAVICSSSRDADKKRGAPGSKLTVGGIEVMYSNR